MVQHLAFLRRFKGLLKLKLNATEDLMVNGAKAPTERGACRHLLAKVDRAAVQKALTKEQLGTDRAQRARFLAGVVRIHPDEDWLLAYLASLAETAEHRDAARAFQSTVDRFDFAKMSSARLGKLLEVLDSTFEGHDRVQALFGLLGNESFRGALRRTQDALADTLVDPIRPLLEVHRVVFRGEAAPADDADRRRLDDGLAQLLAAPQAVLRSYPEASRARLAKIAMKDGLDDADARASTRKLLDSLPGKDGAYDGLQRARVEQLLRAGEVGAAAKALTKLCNSGDRWASRMARAVGGRRLGEVAFESKASRDDDQLRPGVWTPGPTFAWVRTAPAAEAGRLTQEARLQRGLLMLGVAPILGTGLGEDGTVFVAVVSRGRQMSVHRRLRLLDALEVASDGVRLLGQLAASGVALPDVDPDRFLWLGGSPPKLVLANLRGVRRLDPAAAQIAHSALAVTWAASHLDGVDGVPEEVTRRLAGAPPLPVLAGALAIALVEEHPRAQRAEREAPAADHDA